MVFGGIILRNIEISFSEFAATTALASLLVGPGGHALTLSVGY